MNINYTLPSVEQVFGEQGLDIFKAIGTKCAQTAFAAALGAEGSWLLSSAAGYGDVCIVKENGERAVGYASGGGGVRPAFACEEISKVSDKVVKDISGHLLAEYGEYPQDAAEKMLARFLEDEHRSGMLRKTGKVYMGAYEEYEYKGTKYVRVKPEEERAKWFMVSPLKWYYDETAGLLLCKSIIAYVKEYCLDTVYEGDFSKTEVCRFLNGTFAEDIVPSVLRELTAEEQAEYDAYIRRAEARRNPYDLTFGRVTEEDIIRGAIESDIAVFLHGPSSEGKSARIRQIDPTCEIIYLRNATPDSLNGRSVYNQSTGEMIDLPPTWYKKVVAKCEAEPDKLHVVFFDEINNALPSIQGMAFNIVLDKEVNGLWKLPENARVVAAGNDMQDSLAAHQLAAPFFNRFAHVYINTTTEKWLAWAREYDIHPAVYSFIAYKRGETLRSTYDGEKPNADPRKWEMASKMLYATGRPEMLRSLIGEEITEEFVQFCARPVITLDRVLRGDYTERDIEELDTAERYATTMGLSQVSDEDAGIVMAFIGKLGPEFLAVFDSLRTHGAPDRWE